MITNGVGGNPMKIPEEDYIMGELKKSRNINLKRAKVCESNGNKSASYTYFKVAEEVQKLIRKLEKQRMKEGGYEQAAEKIIK